MSTLPKRQAPKAKTVKPKAVKRRGAIKLSDFNQNAHLPYQLRISDFQHAMEDIYDFFADVNRLLQRKGLKRLDDMARPAMLSGFISDMITASLANFSRSLVENKYFNGHPDLIVRGIYANDAVKAGKEGVEIKTTNKKGGAVDAHGARNQWLCVFVYTVDKKTEPASRRAPMQFTEVYLGPVTTRDFRKNKRSSEIGTRTATLHAEGLMKWRENWVYRLNQSEQADATPAKRKTSKPR